jgi:Fur family ferric uptake transcriptional regulator
MAVDRRILRDASWLRQQSLLMQSSCIEQGRRGEHDACWNLPGKVQSMHMTAQQQAETLIRATGARLTRPRTRVLEFLLGQAAPLTHHDIHALLPGAALDSVTLYRVLEWLTANNLVHRVAGLDQVWRFGASSGRHDHDHAHFQCTRCDGVTCFNDMPLPRRPKMSAGFARQDMDLLIRGICPHCARVSDRRCAAKPCSAFSISTMIQRHRWQTPSFLDEKLRVTQANLCGERS